MDKVALQATNLLVKEIVCLVNQANSNVRHDPERPGFAKFAIVRLVAESPHEVGLAAFFFSNGKLPDPKEIAIVGQEFLQAGAGNAHELDFCLFRDAGCFAALHDILFARSGSLNHLIHGAIRLIDKTVAESKGKIINNLSFPIGEEFPVVPMRRDKAGEIIHRASER